MKCSCPTQNKIFNVFSIKKPLSQISSKFTVHYKYSDSGIEANVLSCGFCGGNFISIITTLEKEIKIEIAPIRIAIFENLLSRKDELNYMCQREGPYYLLYNT